MEKFNATSPSPLWSDHPLFGEPSFTPDEDLVPPRDCRTPEVPWAPRYVNQIREWIEACNKLHGNACVPEPVPRRPPEDVPLWLIDTDEQRIVPGLSAHRYLALSYVWPESRGSADSAAAPPPRTLLLDNASVADFQQSGFLGSPDTEQRIPAVIRHAIEFTCALGERYLWVDRLCIVQDDVGDGGTLSQVGKMDKIYSGAYLTIIAAATDKMYEKSAAFEGPIYEWPMFKTADSRRRMDWREREIRFSYGAPGTFHSKMSEEQIVGVMSARYVMLSRSRWATRGWTYQEQILCKRAVVFIESGFFWDCHCCVWDGVDLFPRQDFEGIALRADMGQRLNTRSWPDFSLYLDLVCPYNGRQFSYPQDAMLGVTGVLNALDKSFPGGFVYGLPRLFLDHALLWQPFGTGERRVDRSEDGVVKSSLPSWSWSGWQCYVDPWSLCSGLSYLHTDQQQQRGRSWRMRNLVQWHLLKDDEASEPISEPRFFDQHIDINLKCGTLPEGWRYLREVDYDSQKNIVGTSSYFVHDTDPNASFTHPIPLPTTSPHHPRPSIPPYLTCTTTSASLLPATLLKKFASTSFCSFGPSKISVFEEKMFKDGPRDGKNSPVLVLQTLTGVFAGLLRLMNKDPVDEAAPLELIAISTGSAQARDMRASLEWRIYETAFDAYENGSFGQTFRYIPAWISRNGKLALLHDIHAAFTATREPSPRILASFAETTQRCRALDPDPFDNLLDSRSSSPTDRINPAEWFRAREDVLGFEGGDGLWSRRRHTKSAHVLWAMVRRMVGNGLFFEMVKEKGESEELEGDEVVCEFYNVLWVERRDGVAYRRACGWVTKGVWEASAGEVEVTLG